MSIDVADPPAIPADLYRPPERVEPSPPVDTRQGVLPFGQLSWETFERLCLRLAAESRDARHARLYGRRGQAQEGIDVYVRRSSGRYEVWQSKRYESFSAAKIKNAVDMFVNGAWRESSDTFVLCVRAPLQDTKQQDEIERQSKRLCSLNIEFETLDAEGFSVRLRDYPEIIDDFFGRAWVKAFCGGDVADKLQERLEPAEATELRRALANLYRSHFEVWDSGGHLPASSLDGSHRRLPLGDRYVEPDLFEATRITSPRPSEFLAGATTETLSTEDELGSRRTVAPSRLRTETVKQRVPVFSWIGKSDRTVILGEAGSGKSTLLRILALEILAETPRDEDVQARWAGYLPIWVPFSFWTESIASAPESRSLKASLRRYLDELDAPNRVWLLVERALDDERLLLLIDGLDEWTNEQAGRTAVGLLRAFVEQKRVSTILTSRPLGYQRLSGFDDRWKVTELASLSRAQQQELALRWFRHVGSAANHPDVTHADQMAMEQARAFVAELHQHPQLQILAGVPLMLWGLIALRLSQARLPRNRFSAYDKLTELILHSHPAKRREAALNRGNATDLSSETQDDVLACLAFDALKHGEETALEASRAKETLVRYLAEELDYLRPDGFRAAEVFLNIGSDATGVLIRKSSRHFGFMHRAFLEFLAARHIVRLDLVEQRRLIGEHGQDPRWLEAILATVYLTLRRSDSAAVVQSIEEADAGLVGMTVRKRLLAELAFGPFDLPTTLAKRLAEDAFSEIETGTWMPLRRALLKLVADGLNADALRSTVQQRIRRWFPDRHPYRSGIYEAMAEWPRSQETLDALWHGLHGTDGSDRRAAAIALAQSYRGASEVEERLRRLLRMPADPDLHAAALDALALGWPDANGIRQFVADARASIDPALRLVAIRALIAAGRHTEKDREELLTLAKGGSDLPWERRDELADALVAGWPGNPPIKTRCLEAWSRTSGGYWEQMEDGIASRVLFLGYSSDAEMIDRLAALFEEEEHVSVVLGIGRNGIHLLPKIFPNASPRLTTAIEAWIPKQQYSENEIAYASLAIRTERVRDQLLGFLKDPKRRGGWFVSALLDGWGMVDLRVSEAMLSLANAEGIASLVVAARLPDILSDKQQCRQRLIDLARHPHTDDGFRSVTVGFQRLGIAESDKEVLRILLDQDFEAPGRHFHCNLDVLMQFFGRDASVRALARKELTRRPDHSFIWSVARWYGQDTELRKEITGALSRLPATLRRALAERLASVARDDDFAQAVMSEYDRDYDASTSTAAAIGYYESTVQRGQVNENDLDRLRQSLVAIGMARESEPQAAFAGLLTLDRLGTFLDLKRTHDDSPVKISLYDQLQVNPVLLRHIARHWERLKRLVNGAQWERIEGIGNKERAEFQLLAAYAEDGSLLEQDIVQRIASENVRARSSGELLIYARAQPGTPKLKALCLSTIQWCPSGSSLPSVDASMTAAELLGDQFGEDLSVRVELEQRLRDSEWRDEFALIALCAGWPSTDAINEAFDWYRKHEYRLHYRPTVCYVMANQYDADRFCERIETMIASMQASAWDLSYHCARGIIRRLRDDDVARAGLFDRLRATSSANARASMPGLLSAASGIDDDLRGWCSDELGRQLAKTGIAEHGLNLAEGNIRSVAHVLLELLEKIRE